MASKYGSWTLVLLKEELKRRGKSVSGRKCQLIERLEALDQMGITEADDEIAREYWMTLPDFTTYSDVHASTKIPKMPMSRITSYLESTEKEFESKCKDMYEERYIRYIRSATTNDNDGESLVFIKGEVWAEYTKRQSYIVDISLDQHSVVKEAQCMCTAGEGPSAHCKHVTTILYAVHRSNSGQILTEETCTQKLQTFHHAKPYKGSPMTCTALQELREQNLSFDPRPKSMRSEEGYFDHFRNTILNYQAECGQGTMPVLQLFQPANPECLNFMHDYCGRQDEAFLNTLSVITMDERVEVERATREQARSERWMQERQKRITSSNFGLICKGKDLKKIAHSLANPVPFSSRSVAHGAKYESVAVEEFERITNCKTNACGLFVDQLQPYLAATPDRIVDADTLLEVKCPYTSHNMFITPQTVPYLEYNGTELTLKSNHNYYYQIQGAMMCANASVCYFCVFTLKDFKIIKICRDEIFLSTLRMMLSGFFDVYYKDVLVNKYVYHNYANYF